MYGTIARMKVKQENVQKLRDLMSEVEQREVPGYRASHILVPDKWNDEILMAVFFDDKASYDKNADDPAMHEDYLRYRALLEADPEWTDGEWESYTP
jgi:quinol monooxygenase YgiN